ncbi:MAG: acyl-CoA dehydrogenase family protein [Planctomycetes bacterium]|nr:acyl-CoA dehydrogenase family protein [Planctomycetota bacterium]
MPLPPSSNYLTDNEDLLWHLEHTVAWEEIVRLVERDFTLPDGPGSVAAAREQYMAIMEEVGRFVANELAPHAEAMDAHGTRLEDGEVVMAPASVAAFEMLKDMGLHGLCIPRELGGMNCPLVLYFALGEVIARADCGSMTHFGFFGGIAQSLLAYAAREGSLKLQDGVVVETRFREVIEEITRGEAWGAMVLTEPGAGSDLGAIRARAVKGPDGKWRLSGEKIFITSGQGQWQIVLARTSDPKEGESGLAGLSLFLVPRVIERDGQKIDNVKVTKVEEKLGHSSSPTVSLLYEDSEAELIGQLGQGFELMLILMNNARVAVGFEALGVCESAHRMATEYAAQRVTMGKAIKDHELIADMLQDMDTTIRGIRALCFEAVNATELAHRLDAKLRLDPPADPTAKEELERRLSRAKRYARDLTPLLKYLASEKAVELARMNMQIHGGMGYIHETGADRLLRDALVLPVYEGTSQIQALMALKDRLGATIKDPAKFVRKATAARAAATFSRGLDRAVHQAEVKLYQSIEAVVARILGTKVKTEWQTLTQGGLSEKLEYLTSKFLRSWDAKQDFAHGLVHAERITRMLCDVRVAKILLRQGKEHPERLVHARRWITRMLPRVTALALEVQSTDLDDLLGRAEAEDAERQAEAATAAHA